MSLIERIEALYLWRGRRTCAGEFGEPMSLLHHALQTAHLAEFDDAAEPLVAAAFLHDIGELLPTTRQPGERDVDDRHEVRGAEYLAESFDARVLEPIRLHVAAKRYLVSVQPGYADALPPATRFSLVLQGGPMSAAEVQAFQALPHAADAVRLRRWDDCARRPRQRTPPLAWYLGLLQALIERQAAPSRLQVGSLSVT